ncbi:uncharacterized protein LOC143892807 isoform X3 [Tasmannia lanceolata]|uniref:uncharacterized protein LOC143892807 isoform X3 n=1 Tax=Tasmannia lanceolata TaxID=3420 RepID=UPI004064B1D3
MTITDICWLDQWPDNVHRSAAPCGPICGPEPLHFGPYASCPYSYFGNGQFEIGYFSFIFLLQILPFELRGHSNSNIPSSIPILQDLELNEVWTGELPEDGYSGLEVRSRLIRWDHLEGYLNLEHESLC